MIEVRLFATFRQGRNKIEFIEADKAKDVQAVLDAFEIPKEEVAICLVNGFHSKPETPVKDEDVLALFPPVGGG